MLRVFPHVLAIIQHHSCQTKYLMDDSIPELYKYSVLSHLEWTTWKRWCLNLVASPIQHDLFTILFT